MTNEEIAAQLHEAFGLMLSVEAIVFRLEPALIRAMPLSAAGIVSDAYNLRGRIITLARRFEPPLRSEAFMKADKAMEIKEGQAI